MRAKKVHDNLLLEKFLYDVTPDEVITKDFIDNLFLDDFMIKSYTYDYINEENIDVDDYLDNEEAVEAISNSEDFKNWLKYELESRFEIVQDTFLNLVDDDGYIEIYRAMTVSDDYLDKIKKGEIKRIGHYWTYLRDYAEPHWGYGHNQNNLIVFESKIKEPQINWIDTFRLNLEHENVNEEHEIRLFKNTPLYITNICWNDKEVDEEVINRINQLKILA